MRIEDPRDPVQIKDALHQVGLTSFQQSALNAPFLRMEAFNRRDSIEVVPVKAGVMEIDKGCSGKLRRHKNFWYIDVKADTKIQDGGKYINTRLRALPFSTAIIQELSETHPEVTHIGGTLENELLTAYFAARGENMDGEDPVEVGKRRLIENQSATDDDTQKRARSDAVRKTWAFTLAQATGFDGEIEVEERYDPQFKNPFFVNVFLGKKIS